MNPYLWVPAILLVWVLGMCGVMALVTERDFRRTLQKGDIDTTPEDE